MGAIKHVGCGPVQAQSCGWESFMFFIYVYISIIFLGEVLKCGCVLSFGDFCFVVSPSQHWQKDSWRLDLVPIQWGVILMHASQHTEETGQTTLSHVSLYGLINLGGLPRFIKLLEDLQFNVKLMLFLCHCDNLAKKHKKLFSNVMLFFLCQI